MVENFVKGSFQNSKDVWTRIGRKFQKIGTESNIELYNTLLKTLSNFRKEICRRFTDITTTNIREFQNIERQANPKCGQEI